MKIELNDNRPYTGKSRAFLSMIAETQGDELILENLKAKAKELNLEVYLGTYQRETLLSEIVNFAIPYENRPSN